jgi:oligoendopeptidase F
MEEMNTYHHEFVTHLLEAELLRRLYWRAERGESLGEKVITGQKAAVLRQFWGDSVEIQDIDGIAWIRQPHYYMNLYPYAYSVGLTVATLAAEMIEREGAPARSRWIEMMKAGSSLPALGLFRLVGIDMSTEEPLKKMAAHVGKVVTELEATFEG